MEFFVGVPVIVLLIVALVEWNVHHVMTKRHTPVFGRGTFRDFVREFESRTWVYNPEFSSFFSEPHCVSECHAGIISFDKRGMILSPWGYWRVWLYLRQHRVKTYGTVDWSNGVPK